MGAPETTRTSGLGIRNPSLYPPELRGPSNRKLRRLEFVRQGAGETHCAAGGAIVESTLSCFSTGCVHVALNTYCSIEGWFTTLRRNLPLSPGSSLVGASIIQSDWSSVPVASNPAIMQLHVPYPASLLQLPKPPVRDIPDYDEKLKAIAEAYLDHDVWALTGTTCWYSVLFDHLLAAAKRRGRAVSTINDLWPNLRVLFAGGVPAEPYRKLIESRVGRPDRKSVV